MIKKNTSEKGILRVTLCDADNKNSLSKEMMHKLIEVFESSNYDDSIKVIILSPSLNLEADKTV